MTQIGIRLAHSGDANALAHLRWALKAEELAPEEAKDAFIRRYAESIRVDDPTVHRWIAEEGNVAIGTVSVRLARKELSPGCEAEDIGYLTNFLVFPSHRNAGVGAGLLQALIDWACASPVELIFVWPSDRSRPLYQRIGFTGSSDPMVLEL